MTAVRVALVLALASLSCFGTAQPPPVVHVFPVRTHTLPGGLRVVIEQDDGAKLVGVTWVIDVGGADDPGSRPGMAHLVEHLLFSLPDGNGSSMWRRLLDLGAQPVNGQTGTDHTTVYAFTPRAALDDLLELILSRAGDPGRGLDEAGIARERPVLDEELSLHDADPGRAARLAMGSMLGHPFEHPSAAVRSALAAVTVDDVRAFLAAHYRPEKMTLVLSGPLPADWDQRFLAKLPASLVGVPGQRRSPVRHPLAPFEGAGPPRPDITSIPAPVREPELWLAWPLPPVHGKAEVPFDMAAYLVGRALMAQADGDEPTTVSHASAFTVDAAMSHLFVVRVSLKHDADPAAARQEVRQVLDRFVGLPRADWLEEPRRVAGLQLQAERLREALGMESLVTRTLRRAALAHDTPDQTMADVIGAVIDSSLEGVADVVSKYLAGPPACSLRLGPQSMAALPARLTLAADVSTPGAGAHGTLDQEPSRADEEPAAHDARAVLAVAQAPGAAAARVSRLDNGLTLIVLRRPGLPFVSMRLGFHADPRPDETPGVRVAVSLGRAFRIARGPLERAILQTSFLDRDSFGESFGMFSYSAESAMDLLSRESVAFLTRWPAPSAVAWLARERLREATPEDRAEAAFRQGLFRDHPYRLDERADDVYRVPPEAVEAWVERVRRPANGALVVVGDIDPETVERQVRDGLSDWSGDASPVPPPLAPPVRPAHVGPAPVVSLALVRDNWTKVEIGCFLPPARSPRDIVVGELLVHALNDDLYRRLRVEMGASYAPSLKALTWRGGTQVLTGVLDVDRRVAARALAVMHEWLDASGTATPAPASVERARWSLARGSGLRDATNADLAQHLFDAWNMGWEPASLDAFPRDLAGISAAEVTAALNACRASAVISVLGAP